MREGLIEFFFTKVNRFLEAGFSNNRGFDEIIYVIFLIQADADKRVAGYADNSRFKIKGFSRRSEKQGCLDAIPAALLEDLSWQSNALYAPGGK
jgi:hypothetical protein